MNGHNAATCGENCVGGCRLLVLAMMYITTGCGASQRLTSPPVDQDSLTSTPDQARSLDQPKASVHASPEAEALKLISGSKSKLYTHSAQAKIGHRLPFISGWMLTSLSLQPVNINDLLKRGEKREISRYIVTLCAQYCKPCLDGLDRLSQHESSFKEHRAELVVIVVDTTAHAKAIYKRYGLSWSTVITDEFKTNAKKLSISAGGGIELPKTFVLDQRGDVIKIIGEEGDDFLYHLFN